ncbi:MAG: S8/S53 family peptidase [Rhodothermales bacterium]
MPSRVVAQFTAFSVEQLREIEQEAFTSAKAWAAQNNFPEFTTLSDHSAIGIVRMEDQHPVFFTTHNSLAGDHTHTNTLHDASKLGFKLTGSGLYVGLWDAGAVLKDHQEMGSKVNQLDRGVTSNHSTHVAGTLIASGQIPEAKGMAPDASLYAYDWNFHVSEMQSEARAGLMISNHSYGRIAGWQQMSVIPGENDWFWFGDPTVSESEDYSFGFYDDDALLFDHVAYGNIYYLPVVSAGNERDDRGPESGFYRALNTQNRWITHDVTTRPLQADGGTDGFDSMTGIALAKNVLTVGALGFSQNSTQPTLSVFSSAGPTDDGRIKPDIMGIGENLMSPIASGTTDYARYSGTSMASPNVAGSLVLLQQLAEQLLGQPLRAATLKGLVIHTATDLGATGPDFNHGWGLLNTERAALQIDASFRKTGRIQEDQIDGGVTHTHELIRDENQFDSTSPIKITLSWTDQPGQPNNATGPERLNNRAPILLNDLDLSLEHSESGAIFLPYTLSASNPEAPARPGINNVDPVEQIYIETPVAGSYLLKVSHKGANAATAKQLYSLILSGIETSNPAISIDTVFADAQVGKVNLTWDTQREPVNGSFEIERANLTTNEISTPLSLNYTSLAQVTSEGSANQGESYHFEDELYIKGIYQYRILFIDGASGKRTLLTEINVDIPAPSDFSIDSAYPNPARDQVTLAVDLPETMAFSYNAYDLLGRQVYQSITEMRTAGRHFLNLNTSAWTPGIYFLTVRSQDRQLVRKIVVMG